MYGVRDIQSIKCLQGRGFPPFPKFGEESDFYGMDLAERLWRGVIE